MASSQDLTTTISTLLHSYITAFNASDLPGAAAYYDEPSAMITTAGVQVLLTQKDYISLFETTMGRLKAEGWVRSEYVGEKSIVALADGFVLASCPCKRLRVDGSSVEEFTPAYTLRKAEGKGWVICSIHSADFGRVLRT